MLKIHIGEGKGIQLRIPTAGTTAGSVTGAFTTKDPAGIVINGRKQRQTAEPEVVADTLERKYFQIREVRRGPETGIRDGVLTIREGIERELAERNGNICECSLEILTPEKYHTFSETVMDVQPIAAKAGEDSLGTGVTYVLDGVVMMLSGVTESGAQIGEFGSSEGYLDENIMWGRPGCPDEGDILIKLNAVILDGKNMERPGPTAVHEAADMVTSEIRNVMKKLDESACIRTERFRQIRNRKYRIVIVKEVMGQGAMHDNIFLPSEPAGMMGGRSNIDLGNLPVAFNPLEILDGGIHAMTCVGPASKEMTRHYFREPLIELALQEDEIEVAGVVMIGSSQINTEKFYSSDRLGRMIELMNVDGAIITTEGFGNNHIDFLAHHEQFGKRGIPVVGMSYCGVQGALVVGNAYMDSMVELNKSFMGVENEVLGCNTLCREDAYKAISMLKSKIDGEEIGKAYKKWKPETCTDNNEIFEAATGIEMKQARDESTIPLSEKRKKKYHL